MNVIPTAQLCSRPLHNCRNGPLRILKTLVENGFRFLPPPVAKSLASSLPSIEAELSAGLTPDA